MKSVVWNCRKQFGRRWLQHQVATLRKSSLRRFAASSISLTTKERNNFESSTDSKDSKDSKELELGVFGPIHL